LEGINSRKGKVAQNNTRRHRLPEIHEVGISSSPCVAPPGAGTQRETLGKGGRRSKKKTPRKRKGKFLLRAKTGNQSGKKAENAHRNWTEKQEKKPPSLDCRGAKSLKRLPAVDEFGETRRLGHKKRGGRPSAAQKDWLQEIKHNA